jgi:hypothetical protein
VTANIQSNSISVLLNAGNGAFSLFTNYTVENSPIYVALGDFNHDGHLDIVVANYLGGSVSILLGNGHGAFSPPTNFPAGDRPSCIAIGDFNKDGKPDLAIANTTAGTVSVLLGNGDGTFASPLTNYVIGRSVLCVAAFDFNRDGNLDLLATSAENGNISIFLGNGDGSFGPANSYVATGVFNGGYDLVFAALGDFDGDGKIDIITANNAESSCTFLKGDGTGLFIVRATNNMGNAPNSVAVADFNGDGKLDFVTSNYASTSNLTLSLGNGAGSFAPATYLSLASGPSFVAAADFNGDGQADIVTARRFLNSVTILLNQTFPVLQISQIGPGTRLSWPNRSDYQLESNANLLQTNGWAAVTNIPTVVVDQRVLTNTSPGQTRFFRLRKL